MPSVVCQRPHVNHRSNGSSTTRPLNELPSTQEKKVLRSTNLKSRREAILRRPLGTLLFLAVSSAPPSLLLPFSPRQALAETPVKITSEQIRRQQLEEQREQRKQQRQQKRKQSTSTESSGKKTDIEYIQEASKTLQTLLDNWDKATIDCNYADVPRELLETKNKEELLEKAATYALFDKGAVTVSCRKTNRLVREYIGVTGKGPLVGLEKRMLSRGKGGAVEAVDPDMLDTYFSEVDSFSRSISKASSLSYTAGMADLNSLNNFSKDQDSNSKQPPEYSNLEEARKAIMNAKESIDLILKIIASGTEIATMVSVE